MVYSLTMSNSKNPRYAIYFTGAPGGELWQKGSQWLGRSTTGEQVLPLPKILNLNAALHQEVTTQPRRYGWHATLKAPFALKDHVSFQELDSAMASLASKLKAFDLPTLGIKWMKGFLALAPEQSTQKYPELKGAAERCVEEIHDLVRPLNPAEMSYRKSFDLSARELEMVERWGYPYVKELFEFHFTLTNNLDLCSTQDQKKWASAAKEWFQFDRSIRFDRIALFVETDRGQDFMFLHDYTLPL